MSKRIITMLVALVALAAVAAGCGDDEDAGAETLTKAEFIKRGDAMCQRANKEFQRDLQALGTENRKKGVTGRTLREEGIEISEKIFLPNTQSRADRLAAIPPPSGDEGEIEAIVKAIERGIAKGEEDPNTLFNQNAYPFDEANQLQQKYGFKVCGAG